MKRRNVVNISVVAVLVLAVSSISLLIGCQGEGEEITARLYVGGYDTAKIYVINPDLEELVTTIDLPAGAQPDWLTLSPDNKKLYCSSAVSDEGSHRVYVIDTDTNTYEGKVNVCDGPKGIAFTPDGSKAAVVCSVGGDVAIIDTAMLTYNNDNTDTVWGFTGGGGVVIHPTNNKLYVGGVNSNVGIATVAGSATWNSSYFMSGGSTSIIDVEISHDGNELYLSEQFYDAVEIADISQSDGLLSYNGQVSQAGSPFYGRLTLASGGGRLYVSRYCASEIDYMNTSGTPSMASFDVQYGSNTYGQRDIALSDDGSIAFVLIGHSQYHTIVVLDTTSGSILGTIELPVCTANSIVYKP